MPPKYLSAFAKTSAGTRSPVIASTALLGA